MSTCVPIPPQITNPTLEAEAVQKLQNLFTANLIWLENCYALVRTGFEAHQEEKKYKYPQIYAGLSNKKAEYYDLRPNDQLKSYCFFEVEAPYEYNQEDQTAKYSLAAIFWYNLAKIDGRNYDYSSELIAHVLKVIRGSEYLTKVIDIKVEKRPEEVFSKYSLNPLTDNQFLMYPYGAFKISFIFYDNADCLPDFIALNPNSCEV